ncbi:uncharacterized protein [Clytia hemisphaerica]|uniref:Mitochondrial pyruvate carrier n=1 Tax=Clytia hemisphaerica TaxID=252671 RepID=A0A7M5X5X6_9CNID
MAAARFLLAVERGLPRRLVPLWNHPAGLQTIHFWAPAFKWALVIAGISDIARPPEKLSFSQSSSLAATGLIWSRYSTVIIPKNWNLFSVNVFLCGVGVMQCSRILMHRKKMEEEGQELPPLF